MLSAIVFLTVLSAVSLAFLAWILRDAARRDATARTPQAERARDPRAPGVAPGTPTAAATPPPAALPASPQNADVDGSAAAR